jgi:uncharacterized protein (DUF885 family)
METKELSRKKQLYDLVIHTSFPNLHFQYALSNKEKYVKNLRSQYHKMVIGQK